MMRFVVVMGLSLAMAASSASGSVLCARKTGALAIREAACKGREQQVDVATLGILGPKGDAGAKGDPGDAGTPGTPGTPGAPGAPATALFASVAADGTFVRGSNVASSATLGTGAYEVVFNRDVSACTYMVTTGDTSSIATPSAGMAGITARFMNANGVYLRTYNDAGTSTNLAFHVAVFCP